ncbi:MAG TPA: DUF2298 domain-containing protein [Anaerolineae bacterium]|nr:DUF2298 domain-containing protein [Anaerolineae bacterium]
MNEPTSNTLNSATSSEKRSGIRENWVIVALGLILLLGAVFRFTGVNWDEDQHLHPDERFLTMVSSAIHLPTSLGEYLDTDKSPLNPYNNNFGSFPYGTAPLFIVRIAGELVRQTDYWNIFMVGRVMSALFDLFTCAMVFAIGRRLFGARVGLLAAFLYACAVLAIQESHFFTVDAFSNVPIVIAFWFALDIMEGKRGWLAYLLAGAAFGLAVASRINFVTFAAIILLAALLRLVTMLGSIKRVGLAADEQASVPSRTYSMEAGAVPPQDMPLNAANVGGQTRTITLGPLIIEIETKTRGQVGEEAAESSLDSATFWNSVFYIGTGLVITLLAAVLIFRIAQPYAFKGVFGLNPKWLDDLKLNSELVSGEADYPPSDQWTGRAAYLFPLYNIFNYGLGIPFALAAWAGFIVGSYEILRYRKWNHLLLVLWIGGFFLYMGQQFVLVIRYYLPLYPFFAIYAAFFVFWLWDHAKLLQVPWNTIARAAVVLFAVIVIGYTLFWAGAFTSIYTRPVSRIAASIWMVHNIPEGSVIANEQWDDPLPMRVEGMDPFGGMFKGLSSSGSGLMENYGEDGPEKREELQKWLDEADYIVLSSNRLYQSIPRLPRRYPLTTKYYEWLFNGQLGFDLIQTFTSYPQLFGITINDDSSDEAFTVYDHPKVLIFKKTERYSSENTAKLLDSVDLSEIERLKPIDAVASKGGFRMSPELLAANYSGGTWSDIFNPTDFINQIPVIAWVVIIWLIGILAFPYAFIAFRRLADRGYAFTKAIGVLTLAWLTWTLASYRALPFERTTMLLVLGVMLVGALFVVWRKRVELGEYVRANWKLLVLVEVVYLAFFALDLAIRYGNPDLWHPYFGGEKPMDLAYLNAIIKTTYFPAYNPWFAGGFINYYYFGQVVSATLVKLTGIVPEVAYNLLLPMFFGLTASGAFGVGYNVVARVTDDGRPLDSARGRLPTDDGRTTDDDSHSIRYVLGLPIRAIVAGLVAVVFVLIIGNLGQVGVLFQGLSDLGRQGGATNGLGAFLGGLFAWIGGSEIPVPIGNWYWTATRVIPDTINEFPFFTFVYADLHAHLMALPFTLVGLGLAVHAVFLRGKLRWYDLGIAALVLGALRATNTWDYPTYLALIGCAMVIGYFVGRRAEDQGEFSWSEWIQRYLLFIVLVFVQVAAIVIPTNAAGTRITFDMAIYIVVMLFAVFLGFIKFGVHLDPRRLGWDLGWRMIGLIALAVLFFWPYIANYGTAYTSVELWKDARTVLTDYLVVHGIFLFLTTTYLLVLVLNRRARTMDDSVEATNQSWLDGWVIYLVPALAVLVVGLLFLGLQVFAVILPLEAIAAWVLVERKTAPIHRFLSLLVLAALLLTMMVEVVTLKGDIGRMNTVFKFYLQAWVFFAIASAAGLAIVFDRLWFRSPQTDKATGEQTGGDSSTLATVKSLWWGLAALLIFAGLLYPIFAGWAKVNDRYTAGSPAGLNGLDYMQQASFNENDHEMILEQDRRAIEWLRENIKGSPVIVEGNTGLYHWGDRVSINTGLPTVIGWDWHTKQQYSLLPGEIIDNRIRDVKTIYETPDPNEAIALANKYGASLIYVGPVERAVYDPSGLDKFEGMAQVGGIQKIYDNDGVQIYALPNKVAEVVK